MIPFLAHQISRTQKLDDATIGEPVGRQVPQYTASENRTACNPSGETGQQLTTQYIHLTSNPANPLLGAHPEGAPPTILKCTRTRPFTSASLTAAKYWKLSEYPNIGNWANKLWSTMEQVQLEKGAGRRDCQGELRRGEDATSRKAHAQVCSPRPRVERGAESTPTHL